MPGVPFCPELRSSADRQPVQWWQPPTTPRTFRWSNAMTISAPLHQSRYRKTKVEILGLIQALLLSSLIVATQRADAQTYTVLDRFTHAEGGFSTGPLIQDDKGNLYGTTQIGRTSAEYGTAFKLNQHGTVTVLHTFHRRQGWGMAGRRRDSGCGRELVRNNHDRRRPYKFTP